MILFWKKASRRLPKKTGVVIVRTAYTTSMSYYDQWSRKFSVPGVIYWMKSPTPPEKSYMKCYVRHLISILRDRIRVHLVRFKVYNF